MMFAALRALVVGGLLVSVATTAAAEELELWDALRSGEAFAIMRHAVAPGTGDPENFRLGSCKTQRNLDDRGRQQASVIGQRFRTRGITDVDVYSSEWCRCRETGELMGIGAVQPLPALNSIFGRPERREPQTAELLAWLSERNSEKPLVLISHQVNIRALTGGPTRSGEIVVLRREPDGELTELGRL